MPAAEAPRADDLGHPVDLGAGSVHRVVSLVPSLTEGIALASPDLLVGATDWCTHPADLDARGVVRVRGTKNPDLAAIGALRPDLVVANEEENRELDVRRLREAGIAVWVTRIRTVAEAFASLERLFALLRYAASVPDPAWLAAARTAWGEVDPPVERRRVVVPIWRDPWMVVGHPTFTADLLARAGLDVVPTGQGRYPKVELAVLDDPALADAVILPDEPYVFTESDGPEAFTALPTVLASGRLLTWYGPALVESAPALQALAGTVVARSAEGSG